jgi:glyoxylase-like metal-dependent hydrolase (beta-lactamase superfamily II)
MRVVAVTTGAVRGKRSSSPRRYLPGGWSGETVPVLAYAVIHPDGVCLFDTGQTARAARAGYHPPWHPLLRLARFELAEGDEVAPRLRAAGVDPDAVRWVVLSHLHTDHVGGLDAFAGADVIVSAAEWRRAQGLGGRLRGYLPQHWPAGVTPRVVDPAGPPVGPFPASYDVAGDGALVVVPTPGHTPGHVSLLVGAGACRRLLAGDLAATPADLRRSAPPIAAWCEAEGVTVLTAHDPAATETGG